MAQRRQVLCAEFRSIGSKLRAFRLDSAATASQVRGKSGGTVGLMDGVRSAVRTTRYLTVGPSACAEGVKKANTTPEGQRTCNAFLLVWVVNALAQSKRYTREW